MFHIKICGVRTIEAVDAAADSGADAIGLNFFSRSIRFIDPHQSLARELSDHAARRGLLRIGVFVNASVSEIQRTFEEVGLDAIQLHGDEPLELARELSESQCFRVIRAVKLPVGALDPALIESRIRPWIEATCYPLLDVDAGASHGGSGSTLDWDSIGRWSLQHPGDRFTLAGGLDAGNVSDAIQRSRAPSVDTASGVENPRGVKRRELIEAFIRNCPSK